MKMLLKNTLLIPIIALGVIFSLPVYAATPGVSVFGGIHASDNIGRIDYNSLTQLNAVMNQRGIPMYLYGGAPQYYINTPTPQLFSSIGNFLQESSTPSNIVWWAGHGTLNAPGGWDNTYVGRQEFFARTRSIADSLGKDVIITDLSCGSGACVAPEVSQYLGGHLKGVITITGAGQLGYTGQLEQMLSNAGGFATGVDVNKDGAITMGELKSFSDQQGWPFKFAGDMNHKLFYGKDASSEQNPELAENVCIVLPPASDVLSVEEDSRMDAYPVTVAELKANAQREKKDSVTKIYFFVPDKANIKKFLDGLPNNAAYTINGISISAGPYGIGKTILLDKPQNASAYFKITSGDHCTAEPIKYEAPNPNTLQGGNGLLGSNNGFGGMGGGLGNNALLPLLMQGLLGQGLGGGRGQGGYGNNQNPYGSQYPPYNQQSQDCSRVSESPVCGVDGRTYRNNCYIRQANVALQGQGVCDRVESSSPIPTVTPNASSILNQINQSGIPGALIESVRNAVSTVLSSILSGAALRETVVQ